MRNTGLEETQAGIKIARRNISHLRYADDTTLMVESKELKSLLMKVKQESKNAGLKFNIQEMKIMASGPITSWQIDGKTMETVTHFILGGSKTTADGDCSHEIIRHLLLGRKVMTNLNSTGRSHPTPKARGGGREEQPHVQGAVAAQVQESLEELLHVQGQEGWW